jgi:hypothetical protein
MKIVGDECSGETGREFRTEHLTASGNAALISGYFLSLGIQVQQWTKTRLTR